MLSSQVCAWVDVKCCGWNPIIGTPRDGREVDSSVMRPMGQITIGDNSWQNYRGNRTLHRSDERVVDESRTEEKAWDICTISYFRLRQAILHQFGSPPIFRKSEDGIDMMKRPLLRYINYGRRPPCLRVLGTLQ